MEKKAKMLKRELKIMHARVAAAAIFDIRCF
jgi:hypothetical protein